MRTLLIGIPSLHPVLDIAVLVVVAAAGIGAASALLRRLVA